MLKNDKKGYTFRELGWDTEFFGVTCAKAVLESELTQSEWEELLVLMQGYSFVSILNMDSRAGNSILIGKESKAFLADVNIQYEKKVWKPEGPRSPISVVSGLEPDEDILSLATYSSSKFYADPELRKRNGEEVYREWLRNAFNRQDRYFSLSHDTEGRCNGFLLFSFNEDVCTLELAAVSENVAKQGIGTDLLRACEISALERGCSKLRVGTQALNFPAINLYHKYGFKMVGCHQTYHLWNDTNGINDEGRKVR